MPFGLQPLHLIIIAVIALIIFGPSKLPEFGRSLGKTITEFKRGTQEMTEGLKEELSTASQPAPATPPAQPMAAAQNYNAPQPPAAAAPTYTPAPVQAAPVTNTGKACSLCGTQNLPEARYCNQCGASLAN